jgi:hypothetical protein
MMTTEQIANHAAAVLWPHSPDDRIELLRLVADTLEPDDMPNFEARLLAALAMMLDAVDRLDQPAGRA